MSFFKTARRLLPLIGVLLLITASSYAINIFGSRVPPTKVQTTDPGGVELGFKFRSSQNGSIQAIRFYRGVESASDYKVTLWSSSGAVIATAVLKKKRFGDRGLACGSF